MTGQHGALRRGIGHRQGFRCYFYGFSRLFLGGILCRFRARLAGFARQLEVGREPDAEDVAEGAERAAELGFSGDCRHDVRLGEKMGELGARPLDLVAGEQAGQPAEAGGQRHGGGWFGCEKPDAIGPRFGGRRSKSTGEGLGEAAGEVRKPVPDGVIEVRIEAAGVSLVACGLAQEREDGDEAVQKRKRREVSLAGHDVNMA